MRKYIWKIIVILAILGIILIWTGKAKGTEVTSSSTTVATITLDEVCVYANKAPAPRPMPANFRPKPHMAKPIFMAPPSSPMHI